MIHKPLAAQVYYLINHIDDISVWPLCHTFETQKKGPELVAPALLSLFVRRRNVVRRGEEGEERVSSPRQTCDQAVRANSG